MGGICRLYHAERSEISSDTVNTALMAEPKMGDQPGDLIHLKTG
jgi:hypothetical protein